MGVSCDVFHQEERGLAGARVNASKSAAVGLRELEGAITDPSQDGELVFPSGKGGFRGDGGLHDLLRRLAKQMNPAWFDWYWS